MIRVLMINGGPLDYGGITSFMLNYAEQISSDRVVFDYVVHGYEKGSREDEVLRTGSKVYHIPYKRQHYLQNRKALCELFRNGGYEIVHSHLDGMNGYVLGLAKACGVPYRISHCHNTDYLTTNPIRRYMHTQKAAQIPSVATDLFACSQDAAQFFYKERTSKASVIKNAIDLERFAYSEEKRNCIRREYNIPDDAFVIGHVGRFDYQKNHGFLLDAFAKYKKTNCYLFLLGDGMLRDKIQQQANELGIGKRVVIAGYRKDAADCYSAFDAFVLPSLFEGLGIVLVEAQASGLPCIASDRVPYDACLSESSRIPLHESDWIAALDHLSKENDRYKCGKRNRTLLSEKGFDINTEAEKLVAYYEGLLL